MADGNTHRYDLEFFHESVNRHDKPMDCQVLLICPVGMTFTEVFLFQKVRFLLTVHSAFPFKLTNGIKGSIIIANAWQVGCLSV